MVECDFVLAPRAEVLSHESLGEHLLNGLLLVAHRTAPFVAALLLLLHMNIEVFKYDEREREKESESEYLHGGALATLGDDEDR